jgi:hypothetical protein
MAATPGDLDSHLAPFKEYMAATENEGEWSNEGPVFDPERVTRNESASGTVLMADDTTSADQIPLSGRRFRRDEGSYSFYACALPELCPDAERGEKFDVILLCETNADYCIGAIEPSLDSLTDSTPFYKDGTCFRYSDGDMYSDGTQVPDDGVQLPHFGGDAVIALSLDYSQILRGEGEGGVLSVTLPGDGGFPAPTVARRDVPPGFVPCVATKGLVTAVRHRLVRPSPMVKRAVGGR